MKILLAIVIFTICNNGYAIQLFPSGIKVSFEAPQKPSRKTYLIQREEDIEQKNLTTYRLIRVINGINNIPEGQFLGLVFYNKRNRVIGNVPILKSKKLGPNSIFFIDRDSGRRFQGLVDNYLIPKKTVSFGLAYINKRGRVQSSPFTHPDFEENGHILLNTFLALNPKQNIMLQYEVVGTFENPQVKLGGFIIKQ